MHGAGRAKTGAQVVHANDKETVCIDRFARANHVVPPAFTFVLAFVDARDMVRRIQRMANENRIGFVGVERAVSLEGQLIGADRGATLQSKWCFKKHRLRLRDQWHEEVNPKNGSANYRCIKAWPARCGWRWLLGVLQQVLHFFQGLQGPPHKAKPPSTAKTTADILCIHLSETLRVMTSPNQTTGALASIMPKVVPATTQNQLLN